MAVYIGSAIYTAGLEGVMHQFGVSDVAALLGLTMFVLGYALGPMVLVHPSHFSAWYHPQLMSKGPNV